MDTEIKALIKEGKEVSFYNPYKEIKEYKQEEIFLMNQISAVSTKIARLTAASKKIGRLKIVTNDESYPDYETKLRNMHASLTKERMIDGKPTTDLKTINEDPSPVTTFFMKVFNAISSAFRGPGYYEFWYPGYALEKPMKEVEKSLEQTPKQKISK